MAGYQIGAIICISSCAFFTAFAVMFALLKEKGAMLISGFNTMGKEEREKYDKLKMSADMKNSLIIWAVIMFVGGVLSYFVSFYFSAAAFVIWLILLFKEVKLYPDKAFDKYRL